MAIFNVRTNVLYPEGIELPYQINLEMNCRGKIRHALLTSEEAVKIRPYMFLDLLSEIMPKWLYTRNAYVSFGYTRVNHPILGQHTQPCLVVEDEIYGTINYLINRCSDEKWLETIYDTNLAAMVLWWRENRDSFFWKPVQKWEIEKI